MIRFYDEKKECQESELLILLKDGKQCRLFDFRRCNNCKFRSFEGRDFK